MSAKERPANATGRSLPCTPRPKLEGIEQGVDSTLLFLHAGLVVRLFPSVALCAVTGPLTLQAFKNVC